MRTLGEVEGRWSLSFGEVERVLLLWPLEGRAIGLEEDLSPSMVSEGGTEEEGEGDGEGVCLGGMGRKEESGFAW